MSTPAIETKQLRKTFKVGFAGLRQVEALRGLDLQVQPGEIYGFLGPNGAGKSTTIKILTRLIEASSGEALVFGAPLDTPSARRRVGYLPENPAFYEFLTGRELLRHYGALSGLPRRRAGDRAEELLDQVGLGRAGALQVRRYSKGMVQRLGIAQALLHDPELVILDEPVSGLDPIGRREMRDLILGLRDRGKTVFFSTHIIPDVEMICDRVGIIIAGRRVREGAVAELLSSEVVATEVVVGDVPLPAVQGLARGAPIREVGNGFAVTLPAEGDVEALLRAALAAGARVRSVQSQGRALEDIFIEQISREDAGTSDVAPRANFARGGRA